METNINKYKLKQNNKEYCLTICIVGNSIRMSCKCTTSGNGAEFSKDFSLDELKRAEQLFSSMTTPVEVLKYIDTILKYHKVRVSDEEKSIRIEFFIKTKGEMHKLKLPFGGEFTEFNSTKINTNVETATEDYSKYFDTNIQNQFISTNETTTTTQINTNSGGYNVPYITPADDLNINNYLDNTKTITETKIETNQFDTQFNLNDMQFNQPTTDYQNYQNIETSYTDNQYKFDMKSFEENTNYEPNMNVQPNLNVESNLNIQPNVEPKPTEEPKLPVEPKPKVETISDERIVKLEGDASSLRNEHMEMQNKLKLLSGQVDQYKNKIEMMEKEKVMNELNSLRAENSTIKQQLMELRYKKPETPDLNLLMSQFSELNLLKSKISELAGGQEKLRQNEKVMEDLRSQIKDLESIKSKYEEELKTLKETKVTKTTQVVEQEKVIAMNKASMEKSSGMDSKQLLFEEKSQQFCVKGDIIHNTDELEFITRKINKFNQRLTLNLIYKATADSDTAQAFHAKCDDAKSTLVLVETDKGRRFGGFTTQDWKGECIEKMDEDAFVFSLDKMKIYENIHDEEAIGCYPNFGPIFLGCQIRIYDNAFTKGGTTYERGLNYNTEENFELNGGERVFNVKDIEVYEVIPQ